MIESKKNINPYWKKLVSTGLRFLQEQRKTDAITIIKNSTFDVIHNSHDNWDGGIDYWDLIFYLRFKEYTTISDRKEALESDLLSIFESIHPDSRNQIANVMIQPKIEQYIDWNAILPSTKEITIKTIQEEERLLTEVATGKRSFKGSGEEEQFHNRHEKILAIAQRTGFDYPIKANTLAEWWAEVRKFPTYAERREYISSLFSPVLKTLYESEDNNISVDFHQISTRSETIQKAVEDAEMFIREGRFDSAADRVHTAFHGYLKALLTEHDVSYDSDDKLPALFSKLIYFYNDSIQPKEVAERIKKILRSAGGMINVVNELRNNNTIAHPNGQLIQVREAMLVIRLVNAVVDYLEDVEKCIGN